MAVRKFARTCAFEACSGGRLGDADYGRKKSDPRVAEKLLAARPKKRLLAIPASSKLSKIAPEAEVRPNFGQFWPSFGRWQPNMVNFGQRVAGVSESLSNFGRVGRKRDLDLATIVRRWSELAKACRGLAKVGQPR